MVFTIMELGYIAFQTIVTEHAAYECARIGSLWAGSLVSTANPEYNVSRARSKASAQLTKMLPKAGLAVCQVAYHQGVDDPQTGKPGADLLIVVENPVRLIFPGSSYMLANPKGTGVRRIRAAVRMPIENPLSATLR